MVGSERAAKRLLTSARSLGIPASLEIITRYDRADALSGEFGLLERGPGSTAHFRGILPKDAFDSSRSCCQCGLGSVPVKAHILRKQSLESRGNFEYGHVGSGFVLMRTEIGQEIIKATGQPECMRHPILRSGEVVKSWMEAVPTAVLPPLSRKSAGILWGATHAVSDIGGPPTQVPSCPKCKRITWSESHEEPTRLVYAKAAIGALRQHAVVLMYEPKDMFPKFNPRDGTFTNLYGFPLPLFNRAAIQVLLKYTQTEHIRDSAWIRPVFLE